MTKDELNAALRELNKLLRKRPKLIDKVNAAIDALEDLDDRAAELGNQLFGFMPMSWTASLPAEPLRDTRKISVSASLPWPAPMPAEPLRGSAIATSSSEIWNTPSDVEA